MAIYSTLFLCEPSELHPAFPGWKLPLRQPVMRTQINPFTREEMMIETSEPEWDDTDSDEIQLPQMGVVAIESDYDSYLRQRIPPFVQSQPHWCSKSLTPVELEPLVAATTDIEEPELETALYAHPSIDAGIEMFPNDFVARLNSADESTLEVIAEKWATTMSTPEYTHSVSGDRLSDDWTVEDALSILKPIAKLARQQINNQIMYLLIEV